MASTLGRNLHMCFSVIKRPLGPQPIGDHDRPNPTASTSTSSSSSSTALVQNFNSLYDYNTTAASDDSSTASNPDLAAAFASQRFFFSTPGRSNSIVESSAERSEGGRLRDSVAVPTYSPDPYADFRRSMQEMVEARGDGDLKSDWEYLHELLLCYLALNPKSTHKFIIGAFSDLLVSLMPAADITRYNV